MTKKEIKDTAKLFAPLDEADIDFRLSEMEASEEDKEAIKAEIELIREKEAKANPAPAKPTKTLNKVYNQVKLVKHDGKLVEGPIIKPNVKITPERAARLNGQEANSLIRYVEVK